MNARFLAGLTLVLLSAFSAGAQPPARVEPAPQTGHTAGVTAVAFRPGAAQLLTAASDGTAILWDLKTGRQLRTYKGGPLSNSFLTASELQEAKMPAGFPLAAKETPAVAAVEFSPDGRSFVMACRPEGFLAVMNANSQAVVWDVESGKRLGAFDLELDCGAIALSRDGKQLLSGGQPLEPAEVKEMTDMGVKVKPSTGVILWDIATGKQLRQFGGYDASYEAVRFSPDGRYVLGGGRDLFASSVPPAAGVAPAPAGVAQPPSAVQGPATQPGAAVPQAEPKPTGVLCLWDAATGEQLVKLLPRGGVTKAAFSPSGQYVLTVGVAETLEVWDVKAKKQLWKLRASAGAFSPDEKQVLAIDPTGKVSIWDLAAGKEVRSIAANFEGVKGIALSADGQYLAVGMTHLLPPRPTSPLKKGTGSEPIGANAVKNGGREVPVPLFQRAAAAGAAAAQPYVPGEAVVFDIAASRAIHSFTARTDPIDFVAVSPTGQHFLVGDCLWDAASGQKLGNLCRTPVQAFSAAFSPDGHRALAANHRSSHWLGNVLGGLFGPPPGEDAAVLLEIPSGKELAKYESKGPIDDRVALGFSADGRRALLAVRTGTIGVWDVAATPPKKSSESRIACNNLAAAFSPDGRLAALSFHENKTLWWDREKGEKISDAGRQKGLPARPGAPPLTSRDGKLQIAVAEDGAAVIVQDVANPAAKKTLKADLTPYEGLRAAGFDARDERFVFAEIFSPYAGLWDMDAGTRLREFSLQEPFSAETIAFAPDGSRVATAGDDGQVTIWDVATGKKVLTVKLASPIMAVAFSPDGSLAAAGCADRTVTVARLAAGEKTVLRGHEGPVDAVAFRPDGKLLLTACREDGTARIWNVAEGKELARLIDIQNRTDWLIVTPEGFYDGSEGGRKLVAFRSGEGLDVQPPEHFPAASPRLRPGLLTEIWRGK